MNIFKYIYAMTVALAISGSMAQAQTTTDSNMKSVISTDAIKSHGY